MRNSFEEVISYTLESTGIFEMQTTFQQIVLLQKRKKMLAQMTFGQG